MPETEQRALPSLRDFPGAGELTIKRTYALTDAALRPYAHFQTKREAARYAREAGLRVYGIWANGVMSKWRAHRSDCPDGVKPARVQPTLTQSGIAGPGGELLMAVSSLYGESVIAAFPRQMSRDGRADVGLERLKRLAQDYADRNSTTVTIYDNWGEGDGERRKLEEITPR